jgi:acyl-CoA synthetase (AMP-forming)/AMP-acid ligase II
VSLIGCGTWRGEREDEVALRFEDDQTLTWAGLDALLNRSVNALLSRDLGPERRVAVFAENSIETVVAYLSGILSGCSGVPINFHLRAEECAYILRDSGAGLVLVGPETVDVGLEAASLAGGIPVVAWGVEARPGVEQWVDLVASGSPSQPPTDMHPRLYLYYTSGTTGFPKATEGVPVPVLGEGCDTVEEQVRAVVAQTPAEMRRALTVSPLYHFAQISVLKRVVLAGRGLVLYRRFDAERTLRAIHEYGVTEALIVPTQWIRLLALPEEVRARYDLSSLRRVVTGAAPCPLDVKYRVLDWFGPVLEEGYGATEIGGLTSIKSSEWLEHPGSVGRVRSGVRLYVLDERNNELGPNEVGALYFEDLTGTVDLRYYNDEEKTRGAHLRPGVWTLGDVGYVDEEGYLFLTDRSADMVNSGGVKIYPAEAEQVIGELSGVADVACIGVPDDDLGEVLHALVVPLDPERPPSAAALIAQTQERLSKFKCPRTVEFVADLGRAPTGKLNKQSLRERHGRGELAQLSVPADRTEVV